MTILSIKEIVELWPVKIQKEQNFTERTIFLHKKNNLKGQNYWRGRNDNGEEARKYVEQKQGEEKKTW